MEEVQKKQTRILSSRQGTQPYSKVIFEFLIHVFLQKYQRLI